VLVQDECMVCATRTLGSKSSWTHLMVLLRDEAQVEPHFGPFGDSANLDAKRTKGSKIISNAPDRTPR
jgi:hypothetical protein